MVSSWKIRKINRDIAKLEVKIEKFEEKLLEVKERKANGDITKAKFQKAKMNISTKIRSLNTAIARKKKARQTFEKKIREKREAEEEEEL
jgi:chromosome segregation ATPase